MEKPRLNAELVQSVHDTIGRLLKSVEMTGPELVYLTSMMVVSVCQVAPTFGEALAKMLEELVPTIREGRPGVIDVEAMRKKLSLLRN